MISDPRTRSLSETAAARGPTRPLHTKGGGQNYLENSLAAAAEPFKGITADGNLISGLFSIQKTGVATQSIREAAAEFLGAVTPEQRARRSLALMRPNGANGATSILRSCVMECRSTR